MAGPRQAKIIPWIYKPSMGFMRWLVRFWFDARVEGQQHFPKGTFVGAMNHSSQMDIPAMALTVPMPVHYFGKKELFDGPLGAWFFAMGGVPVDRGARDTAAMDEALRLLKSGRPFFLAPEGTRRHAGDGAAAVHTGFVRLALSAGVPVVPVAVAGARECLPPGAKLPKRGRILCRVGAPITLDVVPVDKEHHEDHRRIAQSVMDVIYGMKTELDQELGLGLGTLNHSTSLKDKL